ncbi:hypothetical protein WMO13_05845 [Ignatzschineria larvae DSM 13226]|uniref:Uncharacterized protein n=1 Tax=Ignatzschineria larvae DSM 13226 TaxID=1111732 RepID=A0ABZ3BYE6_9GAMM|nr:hypothetical protein [Ignatzschineria larvae]
MRQIAGMMEAGVQDNFRAGSRPKWAPVRRGGLPLTLTEHLAGSISSASNSDSTVVIRSLEKS